MASGTDITPSLATQIESAYQRIGVTKAHYYIGAMILLGVFFDALEQNAVGISGPVLRESWGLGGREIGLLNTMTFTATALGRVMTGLIADRWGRRRMLVINLLIFAAGSLLCALAPTYLVLSLGRFVVGFGLGGEIAVAVVMMAEFFASRYRGSAVALINVTAAGLGNMLAPAFGILVFTIFDGPERWRWVFGLLFLPAILVLFFRRYVPETPRYLASSGDVAHANLVLNRLATGKLRGPIPTQETYLVTHEAAANTGEPGVPSATWTEALRGKYLSRTVLLCIAVCMSYAAQISMLTLMPTILVSRGYAVNRSLWFTLLMQSGSLVGAAVAALLASKLRRKRTLTIGAAIGCAAGLCMAFFGTSIAPIIAFGWLFNFAVIILNTTIWLFAPEQYPTSTRGFGTSIVLAAGSLSGGLFPLIAGAIFDSAGLTGMFITLATLFLILGVVVQFPPETFGKPMEEDNGAIYGH